MGMVLLHTLRGRASTRRPTIVETTGMVLVHLRPSR